MSVMLRLIMWVVGAWIAVAVFGTGLYWLCKAHIWTIIFLAKYWGFL